VNAISAKDVAATVLACRKYDVPFAVAAGRHTTSDASSCEDGLVIDLRLMRKVSVDPVARTITAAGGCLWRDVDNAAARHGLATVGGTVNNTGVGGLTLGGGYGWLAGRHGLVVDNLLSVKMVLADGSLVTASEETLPDLFWGVRGVRGAGQELGVAVQFTLCAHEQRNAVWAGEIVLAFDKVDLVFNFANDLVETRNGDSAMIVNLSTSPLTNGDLVIKLAVFHNGNTKTAQRIFQPLLDADALLVSVAERPYPELNGMMNPSFGDRKRAVDKGAAYTTPLRPAFVKEVLASELWRLLLLVLESDETKLLFEFYSTDKWCEVPVTATAHGHRGDFQNMVIAPRWKYAEDDDIVEQWTLDVAELVVQEREENGSPDEGPITEYGNYDHLSASPRGVYGVSRERLIEVKKVYDPENVFNKWYPLLDEEEELSEGLACIVTLLSPPRSHLDKLGN
jgi:FAD/FMN-containing dehydrogenase